MLKPTAVREPAISPGYETSGNTTRPPGNGFDTCYLALESSPALYGGDTEGYARIEPPAGVIEPLPGTDANPPGSAWNLSFLMATRAPLGLVTTDDWGEAQPGIKLLSNRGDDGVQDILLGVRLSSGGIVADHAGGVHVLVSQYAQNRAYHVECRLDMISDTFQTYVDGMPVGPVLSQITPSASKGIGGFYARGGQAPTQYANTIGSRDFLLIDSISLRAVAVQSPVKLTAFSVTDLTSGSTLLTNDAVVSVSITAEPAEGATIDGYAVTEAPGPPAEGWLPDISTYAIQASPGASITLYAWAKDSAGNVASKSATILYSIAQPVVSNVVITDNANGTATATWTTDIPAEGSVEYGPVSSSSATPAVAAENELLTDHSVTLTDIAADTNYKIVLVNSEKVEPPIYWPDKWPIPGDANMDCRVNILDLIAIRGKLNQSAGTGGNWAADVNKDGRINILDLIFVRGKLNTNCP